MTDTELAPLLSALDASQRAAVVATELPLAILAPAGSGKTRVLTRRIAYQSAVGAADARHVLALTFTRKAAGELRHRLRALGVEGAPTAGTIHAFALAQLRRRFADRGREMPGLLERKARLLAPLIGRPRAAPSGAGGRAARTLELTDLAGEIEWAKARSITPDRYVTEATAAQRHLPRPAPEIAELYRRYEEAKRRARVVDFDDLLWWCGHALETDEEFAASVRIRFRHLYVDEFQDVSPAQLRVIRGVLGERRDLCVVGDDAQAIYGFAGGDPAALSHFARWFPGATVLRLATNYRSTPEIIAVADSVLGVDAGIVRPRPAAAGESGLVPTVRAFDDETAEARGVAAALVEEHHRGTPYRAMAVLVRTNAQSAEFEQAFARAGIPFRLRDAVGFFQRPEVEMALSLMRERERQVPGRPFSDHVSDLEEDARTEEHEERRMHLDALARLGTEYVEMEEHGSLDGFLAWASIATRGEVVGGSEGDQVDLLTFHRAKGLEWDVVFVCGVESGFVPIGYAISPDDKAEEARLLHVALSRAVKDLRITWARSRERAGRTTKRRPSPWLAAIEAELARMRGESEPVDPRAQLKAARARLASGDRPLGAPVGDADPELLDALKRWRLQTARAHEMPAYVIFPNRTLEAIASTKPRTMYELLAVSGVGPSKAERYGPDVLALVNGEAESGD